MMRTLFPALLFLTSCVACDQGSETGPPDSFENLTDEQLWAYVVEADGMAVVGLKNPQDEEGVENGVVLMTDAERSEATTAVEEVPGASVVSEDALLPVVRVRLESLAALSQLRRLPYVEYVEPDLWIELDGA